MKFLEWEMPRSRFVVTGLGRVVGAEVIASGYRVSL